MIVTGIFLFLLGTKIERTSAVQSDVKYEPSKIAIREQIEQSPFPISELRSPPFVPNFVHQGSNYYFGNPFPMLPEPAQPAPNMVTEIKEELDCENVAVMSNSGLNEFRVGKEIPVFKNPVVEVKAKGLIQNLLPIPDISLNVKPIPLLPSIPIPIFNSQVVSQLTLPLQSLNIPGLPLLKSRKSSKVPMLVEEPLRTSGDFLKSEVDVPVKRIPPPPELEPLVLEEVLKPVIVVDRKVILIPFPPDLRTFLPPSVFEAGEPCEPTLCAQNIILERVLPNIVCEKSKTVELISIPASKRVPVVTASLFPNLFVKK